MAAAALFVAGSALRAYGTFKADAAQRQSELQNMYFYLEQEKLAKYQTEREVGIFERKASKAQGDQAVSVGSRGSAVTSSDLMKLAFEKVLMDQEKEAIVREGEFKAKVARMKAGQSKDNADFLGSPERALQNFGGILTGFASL